MLQVRTEVHWQSCGLVPELEYQQVQGRFEVHWQGTKSTFLSPQCTFSLLVKIAIQHTDDLKTQPSENGEASEVYFVSCHILFPI